MDDHPPYGRPEGLSTPASVIGDGRTAFVLANTRPHAVPLCPEVTLRIADEAVDLWYRTEEELGVIGLPPPFWAFAWAGGQALARYVLDNREVVAGRPALDLGSGSGLVAIAAALAGASSVIAADVDSWAGAATGINATANGVDIRVTGADLLDGPAPEGAIVLAGDMFYDRELAPRVLGFLDRALDSGSTSLIGDPGRSYLPTGRLEKLAEYRVSTTRALEDAEIKHTAVWRLAGKR